MTSTAEAPAILGGPKSVVDQDPTLFQWPIVTSEDEQAVLAVLRAGSMSGIDITLQFEAEFAAWQGAKHALCCCNGTASLLAAMFGVGLGAGDEIIGPAMTYWASVLPALQLRATPVLADIDPHTFCINPDDLERRITPRTKAVVIVHQFGHPCDMDRILPIVKKHGLKLIEDLSHAQGGLYKGKRLGSFGDVAAMSLMSGKSFAIGEGGMLTTDSRQIYERAVAFGHYERTKIDRGFITDPGLQQYTGMPLGGVKHRVNQTASAMGRVQLKYYDARCTEIRRGMNRFWDLLEGCPGLRAHRVNPASGSTMAGWYSPVGVYVTEELGGLPISDFTAAVQAEGGICAAYSGNASLLHIHPLFRSADIYHEGHPTAQGNAGQNMLAPVTDYPNTMRFSQVCLNIPRFKHDDRSIIEQHAHAYRKCAEYYAAHGKAQ